MGSRRYGMGFRKGGKDTTPHVIDQNIFADHWGISVPKPPRNDREAANAAQKEKERQIARKIHEVETLHIEFKDIKQITNLWGFDRLTTLRLSNNCIVEIENIDHLVTLTSLDLSFNNISKIKNIARLTNLTDLNLANNQIKVLENMETLTALNALIMGQNLIGQVAEGEAMDISQLFYLRQFENLQLVVLEGNPIADHVNYHNYLVSHVRALGYLDFRLVTQKMRKVAEEKFSENIGEMMAQDEQEKQAREAAAVKDERSQLLKDACLEGFDTMFEDLFDDPEFQRVRPLEVLTPLIELYQSKFQVILDEFIATILQHHKERETEVSTFFREVELAKKEMDEEAAGYIRDFNDRKREIYEELARTDDEDQYDRMLREDGYLAVAIQSLSDALMEMEMFQVEQFEDALVKFERTLSDMNDTQNNEVVVALFMKLKYLEEEFQTTVMDHVNQAFEKWNRDELPQDSMPQDLRNALADKESFHTIFHSSHEARIDKLNNKDDQFRDRCTRRNDDLFKRVRAEMLRRNRDRVQEITEITRLYDDERRSVERADAIPTTLIT